MKVHERPDPSLATIRAAKGVVVGDGRRSHLIDYRDLDEVSS